MAGDFDTSGLMSTIPQKLAEIVKHKSNKLLHGTSPIKFKHYLFITDILSNKSFEFIIKFI